MTVYWEEIESDEEYAALPESGKTSVKEAWFNQYVKDTEDFQSLAEEEKLNVLNNFFAPIPEPEEQRGFLKTMGGLMVEGAKNTLSSARLVDDVTTGNFDPETAGQLSESINRPQPKRPSELTEAQESFASYGEQWDKGEKVSAVLGSIGNVVKQAVTNPKGVAYLSAEQAANMAPPIAMMLAGGAAGSLAGPVGTVVGGYSGAMAGGVTVEAGAEFQSQIQEYLNTNQIQPTPENIQKILETPEIVSPMLSAARKKAVVTSAVDSALGVGSGALVRKTAMKTASNLGKAARIGAAGATNISGEGISEGAGRYAASGKVDIAEAGLEMLAGTGGAITEVPAARKLFRDSADPNVKDVSEIKTEGSTHPVVTKIKEDLESGVISPEFVEKLSQRQDIVDQGISEEILSIVRGPKLTKEDIVTNLSQRADSGELTVDDLLSVATLESTSTLGITDDINKLIIRKQSEKLDNPAALQEEIRRKLTVIPSQPPDLSTPVQPIPQQPKQPDYTQSPFVQEMLDNPAKFQGVKQEAGIPPQVPRVEPSRPDYLNEAVQAPAGQIKQAPDETIQPIKVPRNELTERQEIKSQAIEPQPQVRNEAVTDQPGDVTDMMPEAESIKVETDPARRQEIQNSINEGELILRTGKFNGRKFSDEELQNVQRTVDRAKAKLGTDPDNTPKNTPKNITPRSTLVNTLNNKENNTPDNTPDNTPEAPTPKPVDVAPEGKAKEPWEMSREDFESSHIFRGVGDDNAATPNTFYGVLGKAKSFAKRKGIKNPSIRIAKKSDVDQDILWDDDTPVSVDDILNKYGEIGSSLIEVKPSYEIPADGIDNPHKFLVKQAIDSGKIDSHPDYPELSKPKSRQEIRREKRDNVQTLRGRIKQLGGLNWGNFKGELKDTVLAVRMLSKKTGMPIDVAEQNLKSEGWLLEDESLIDILRDDPTVLRRGKTSQDISEKTRNLTDQEKKFKEDLEYEQEMPPEGEYVFENAEDLPVGKKLTIISGDNIPSGWDTYEVIEKDPFEVTLQDGKTVKLRPLDRVHVRKQDVESGQKVQEQQLGLFGEKKQKPSLFDEKESVRRDATQKRKPKRSDSGQEQLPLFGTIQRDMFDRELKPKFKKTDVEKSPESDMVDSKESENDNATRLEKPSNIPDVDFKPVEPRGAGRVSRPRRVRMFTSGSLRWSGTAIRDKADVASLLSHIRKSPQEFLYSVAIDKDGNVIEIHKYTKGIANESTADPVEISGNSLRTNGVDTVYIVHNHPSQNLSPSLSDTRFSRRVKNILKLKDIKTESIIIAGNKWVDVFSTESEDIRPAVRIKNTPVKERRFVGSDTFSKPLQSPYMVEVWYNENHPNEEGIILFNNQRNVVDFMPFPSGKPTKDVSADIFSRLDETNANQLIFAFNKITTDRRSFVAKFEKAMSVFDAQRGETKGSAVLDVLIDGKSSLQQGIPFKNVSGMSEGISSDEAIGMMDRSKELYSTTKITDTPAFKNWFAGSKVKDDNGKPLVVYSGHANSDLWGTKYDPRKGTAGGFFTTADPKVASNYATGKLGNKEYFENGSQYRFKQKNGKWGKKLWQIELSPEQLEKLSKLKTEKNEYGDSLYPVSGMDRWIYNNKNYDKDARSMSYRGGSNNIFNIWKFYENMGHTIAYSKDGDAPITERQQKNEFEELLDALGIEWQSYDWAQPGVMPLYLSIKNPLDTSKPFPEKVLNALKKKAARELSSINDNDSHWTKYYPLREWVKDIENDDGNHFWATQIPQKAMPILREYGYDGIQDTGGKSGTVDKHAVWIAFDSTQIKSVFNRGTFDPSNPDIRYASGNDLSGLSLKDVQQIFKGQTVGKTNTGFWIQTRSGHAIEIKTVDSITPNEAAFNIGYGRQKENGEFITGSYQDGVIKISKDLGGKWVLSHESEHWLEDTGLLSRQDIKALDYTIQKEKFRQDLSRAERRAYFVQDMLQKREEYRGTPVGRVLQKIADFIDSLVNLVKRTSRGVLKDIESGKVFDQEALEKSSQPDTEYSMTSKQGPGDITTKETSESPMGGKLSSSVSEDYELGEDEFFHGSETGFGSDAKSFYGNLYLSKKKNIAENYGDPYVIAIDKGTKFLTLASKDTTKFIESLFNKYPEHELFQGPFSAYEKLSENGQVPLEEIVDDVLSEAENMIDDMDFNTLGGMFDQAEAVSVAEKMGFAGVLDSNGNAVLFPSSQNKITKISKIASPNPTSQPGKVGKTDSEQYSAEDKYSPEAVKNLSAKHQKIHKSFKKDHLDDLSDVTDGAITYVKGKPDLNIAQTLLSTPLFSWGKSKIEALKRSYEDAVGSQDEFYKAVYEIFDSGDGRSMIDSMETFRKKFPKEYDIVTNYLKHRDMNAVGYRIRQDGDTWIMLNPDEKQSGVFESESDAASAAIHAEIEDLRNGKQWKSDTLAGEIMSKEEAESLSQFQWSDSALRMIRDMRVITDRVFERYIAPMREVIRQAKKDAVKNGWSVIKTGDDFYTHKGGKQKGGKFKSETEAWDSVIETPNIIIESADGFKKTINFRTAIAEIGDLRGFYMPRSRRSGRMTLIAEKEGANPILEKFDIGIVSNSKAANVLNYPTPINRKARQLKRQGYTVKIKKTDEVSEDAFELLKTTMGAIDIANKAAEKVKTFDGIKTLESLGMTGTWDNGTYLLKGQTFRLGYDDILKALGGKYEYVLDDKYGTPQWTFKNAPGDIDKKISKALFEFEGINPDYSRIFAEQLAKNAADIFKLRGARSHMVQRRRNTGKEVWTGYETDPIQAIGNYGKKVAAGEAKGELAQRLIKNLTGTWETWQEYKEREGENADYDEFRKLIRSRSIESSKQPVAYREITTFIKDILRNEDPVDRTLGFLRGLAVAKYLAFRVFAAPAINLTALPTSATATMMSRGIKARKVPFLMWQAGRQFYQYQQDMKKPVSERTLPADIRKLFDEINQKGWLEAQYDRAQLDVLRSRVSRAWGKFIDIGMYAFKISESFNRAVTIVGSYHGLKENGMGHDEALKEAKEISDNAHGVYHKANIPHLARGANIGAQTVKSFYVFRTFSHTYLQNMVDIGYNKKDASALAWMLFSPAVLAGAGASILMPIAKMIGFGSDDPEEEFYRKINEMSGEQGETFARHGIAGLLGVNIKGSLSIDVGVGAVPMNFKELLGAPASVVSDFTDAAGNFYDGDYWKAAEKASPLAFTNILKAARESQEGIRKSSNAPLFYGPEQLRPSIGETMIRGLGFNPSRIAAAKEKIWSDKKRESRYREMRADINEKLYGYYAKPVRSNEEYAEILLEIKEYNDEVKSKGLWNVIPLITSKSIMKNLRRVSRPGKQERNRETR